MNTVLDEVQTRLGGQVTRRLNTPSCVAGCILPQFGLLTLGIDSGECTTGIEKKISIVIVS